MKNQVIILFSALVILLSRTSGLSQERAQWVALDGVSKPGTPIQAVVQKTSSEGTTFEITVPGIWMESVNYGGTVFTRFLLPAVQLAGSGFPQRPGERGWYDFPAETGIAPLPPEKFANAIEIGTLKPVFPQGALGQNPRTEAEMTKLGIDPSGARPGIPTLRALLAVSRANLKADISIEYQTTESKSLQLPSPLVPAGFEGSDQVKPPDEGYTAPALIDEEFYGKFRGAYRGTEEPLSPVSGAGSFATIEAHIPLVEVTTPQIVKILNHMVVLVKHLKGTEDFTCPISWDAWINLFPFINGAAIRDSLTVKGLKIEGSRSAHYLIVTPRVYREELNEFALWKKAKGLNVDFAYVGNAVGDDVPADRNALDAYLEAYFKKNYCHGVYVLLVGDVDVIPSGRTSRVIEPPDAADADSDHVYEVLGDERFPSLYVGRLSINSSEELANQLGKILTYERNPTVGSWPTRATLAANSQNDDGSMFVSPSFPSKYAAAVNAIAAYGGYSSPPTFQVLHAGAASAAVTRAVNQDVVDALNAGRGIVLYRGHGGGSSWLSGWDANGNEFSSSIVSGLNNTVNPIVFSIACQNARLRNTESIAETWMSRVGGGAVAHWGASVNSFTDENHERAKGVFRALYESAYTRLGPATAEAERISHAVTGGGAGWDNNTFCYNLLGDPEMTVRKQTVPRLITLTGIVTNLNGRVLVQVRDSSGAAVPGGFVNLTLADGATINGFLNPQGELPVDGITPLQVTSLDLQADGYPAARVDLPRFKREWLPFDPDAKAGAAILIGLLRSAQDETTLKIHVPGVWVKTTLYGGREVSEIEIPELDKLAGPGFPQQAGERGWYDFPAETGIEPMSPERYEHPFGAGVYKPVFPQSALGKAPNTEREMIAAGIDPAGARPGIPTLRGFLAVSRLNGPNDLSMIPGDAVFHDLQLPAPLKPAGFTGSDQATAAFGYTAPELFDADFYANFRGAYRGTENPITPSGSVGAFTAAEVKLSLVEVTTPTLARVYGDLVVQFKHLKGTEDFVCPFSWDSWMNAMPFINGQAVREALTIKGLKIEGSRSAHYLILTPRLYRSNLDEFALWKQAKGLNVDFAYVGNAKTDDVTPDRNVIDAYIENYFKQNYCHGVYVLLVGDVDVIPSGRTARVDSAPDFSDADSDHIYEVIGDARFPSLYVGRLSINSADELKVQLGKILKYERNPIVGDWPTHVTLAANSQNDDGSMFVSPSFPSKYAAAVNAIASYAGYTDPPAFQVLHAGAASAAVTRAVNQDVVDAVNEGRGIVLYRGHGGGSSWLSGWDANGNEFSSSIVSGLSNSITPIIFSIACQNARLRNDDSIAETWLNQPGGGSVAHFGASVNSYTDENHERAKGLFRALYQSGFTRLGPVTAEGERISYTVTGGGAGWDNNTFCYNLLGDPEMTVRKRAVLPLGALTGKLGHLNGTAFVQVNDASGKPVGGSFVNVTLENGATINGFANGEGQMLLPAVMPAAVASLDLQADGFGAARVTVPKSE
ncbi:MAG: r, partial [Verrucomicrobiales bacterium]|nr:r [Verrucomicrobiales bacterium]